MAKITHKEYAYSAIYQYAQRQPKSNRTNFFLVIVNFYRGKLMTNHHIEVGRDAIMSAGAPARALEEFPELRAEILLSWFLDQSNDPEVVGLVKKAAKLLN